MATGRKQKLKEHRKLIRAQWARDADSIKRDLNNAGAWSRARRRLYYTALAKLGIIDWTQVRG